MSRYQRQVLLPQIGEAGQAKLAGARVLLVGCGALGTVIADQLIRGGIGFLRICDRDVVDRSNLQRQVLFDDADAQAGMPKAVAAQRRLRAINPEVTIEPHVVDVHSGNVEALMEGVTLVLDGTDNVETRYLVNDAAVKRGVPWVYGACVGTGGRAMGVMPNRSPCLRCLFPQPPAVGELPTCDTAGVLASAASVVASVQVVEGMKILLGEESAATQLATIDLWPLRVRTISTIGARGDDCPACGQRQFPFLDARPGGSATSLCGRNTVQVRPPQPTTIDLPAAAAQMERAGKVQRSDFFVRCALAEQKLTLTLFADGRAMIHGTSDPALARSVYARYVGS